MLDKSVVQRIAAQCGIHQEMETVPEYIEFAKAIYALGVKDERERCANLCSGSAYDVVRDVVESIQNS